MAKITLDLSQFKASGVYTIELNQPENVILNTQTTRLVVGFSKKGPINAPVFCKDPKTAKRVYGDIDPSLESRGSFFHRSLLTCLETGPCFALALCPLNNDVDSANPDYSIFKSFSLSTSEENGGSVEKLLSSYFNKEKFYFPDTSYFIANVENSINQGKLLSFVNLNQTPFSIIIRKTGDLNGFNVTARDWFGADNIPTYVKDFDYISEYFVTVDIVQGDWTNLTQLSIDPVYSQYFNSYGLMKDKITSFLNSPSIKSLGSFTGCLIPDLVDGNGVNYSLDTIINNNLATTGLFVAIDRTALQNYDPTVSLTSGAIDMIGHSLINSSVETVNFLSYNFAAQESLSFIEQDDFNWESIDFGVGATSNLPGGDTYGATADGYDANDPEKVAYFESFYGTGNQGKFNNVLVINKGMLSDAQQTLIESLVPGQSIAWDGSSSSHAVISSLTEVTYGADELYKIGISHPSKAAEGTTVGKNATVLSTSVSNETITVAGTAAEGDINIGDWILAMNSGIKYYFRVLDIELSSGNTIITVDDSNDYITSITTFFTIYWESEKGVRGSLFDIIDTFTDSDFALFNYDISPAKLTYSGGIYTGYESSTLYDKFKTGILSDGDAVYVTGAQRLYLRSTFTVDSDNVKIMQLRSYIDADYLTQYSSNWNFANIYDKEGVSTTDTLLVYSFIGDYTTTIDAVISSNHTIATVSGTDGSKVQVGDYLVADPMGTNLVEDYILTRVVSKRKILTGVDTGKYQIVVSQPLANYSNYTKIIRYKKVQDAAPGVQFTYLPGFRMGAYHLPGTKAQLTKILSLLDPDVSGLAVGLLDKNLIVYRYIIDTFNGGLDVMSAPKNIVTKLAKKRQKCLAIMNAPSMAEFIASTDPRFTDPVSNADPKPILKTEYIAQGGNLSLGPSYTYSLPDEENGSKFAGFFAPFLVIRENNKNISIPPAADVSNNFIRKFLNGQQYSITAGPRRGILSNPRLVALEYDFSDDDRANIEPFGWNPIVYRKNRGFMIYGNQTAYQKTLNAFNNLHVRDLLITLEEAIEDVLDGYIFENNDQSTRLEIKGIADRFLDGVRSAGGIYDYSTIIDSSNNTPEIISQKFAIIDIGVEPTIGMQKFINRVTVLENGQISSGGFTVA